MFFPNPNLGLEKGVGFSHELEDNKESLLCEFGVKLKPKFGFGFFGFGFFT